MGKSLAKHPMLDPRNLKKWGEPIHVAQFLQEVGYTNVNGIWGDHNSSGKQLSSPDPNGLKIAAQRGNRDTVSGVERAKRIKSRIQFAIKFAGLSRDIRAVRIGRTDAPSRELLIEKSKEAGLPGEWIYSGENPWFPPRPTFFSDTPTRVKIDEVPKFIQSYVSLVSHVDLALETMRHLSERFILDALSGEVRVNTRDFHYECRTKTIRGYGLVLAAVKECSHQLLDLDKTQNFIIKDKEVSESAKRISKWLPFFGLFERADLAIMGNNAENTFNVRLTVGDISTATNAMGYLLELINSGRVTDVKDFAPAIRQTQNKISSAFRMDTLDDSMLAKHPRKQPKKNVGRVSRHLFIPPTF